MENPFIRNYYRYTPNPRFSSPAPRSIPVSSPGSGSIPGRQPPRSSSSPSPKVISIPVHFVGSGNARSAAVKIQKVFRGFAVRKNVRKIAAIRAEADEMERRILNSKELIRSDAMERLRVNEMLMSLLFRLDAIRGFDSAVRDCRKAVTRKVVSLQERVDATVSLSDAIADEKDVEFKVGATADEKEGEVRSGAIADKKEGESRADAIADEKDGEFVSGAIADVKEGESRADAIADEKEGEFRSGAIANDKEGESRADAIVSLLDAIADEKDGEFRAGSETPALLLDTHDSAAGEVVVDQTPDVHESTDSSSLEKVPSVQNFGNGSDQSPAEPAKDSPHGSDSSGDEMVSGRAVGTDDCQTEKVGGGDLSSCVTKFQEENLAVEKLGRGGGSEKGKAEASEVQEGGKSFDGRCSAALMSMMERLMAENGELKDLMMELCERNTLQNGLIKSLSHRVDVLERAVARSQRMREKKKRRQKEEIKKCGRTFKNYVTILL